MYESVVRGLRINRHPTTQKINSKSTASMVFENVSCQSLFRFQIGVSHTAKTHAATYEAGIVKEKNTRGTTKSPSRNKYNKL